MPAASQTTKGSRPAYPPLLKLLRHEALGFVRGPLIAATLVCYLIRPYMLPSLVAWFATVDLSFLPQFLVEYATSGEYGHTTVRDVCFLAGLLLTIHEVLYFSGNTFLFICDQVGWLSKYRLPRTKRMIPSNGLVARCIGEGIVNHFLAQPVFLYLIFLKVARFEPIFPEDGNNLSGSDPSKVKLPYMEMSFLMTALYLFGALMFNHIFFYIVHRTVHLPGLYIPIHKKHHKFVGTVGWAAEFAHPIEQIFANQLPSTAFVLILFTKEVGQEVALMWIFWRLVETYEAHAGYDFQKSPLGKIGLLHGGMARFHDWHHTDNRGNYGCMCMDWLFGTMDSYAQLVMTHPVTGKLSMTENYSTLHAETKLKGT